MHLPIPVGISSCLLGEEVRYNGGHKRSRLCLNQLDKVFEYHPFCPEVAIGLPTPREAIRMVGTLAEPRVVGTKTPDLDVTDELSNYSESLVTEVDKLCGYIFMQKSPSCGLYSSKIYKGEHPIPGGHAGMFARVLTKALPNLPVEEEGRLHDPVLRENFVARVFAYQDWRESVASEPSPKKLVAFHSRYKFLAMAHGQDAYRELGRLVADAGKENFDQRVQSYLAQFMRFLSKPANRKSHTNTLYHILGFLRESVESAARQEIVKVIESYRKGSVNLSVPASLLKHYVKLYGDDYIKEQVYLEPYSEELGLRNAI